ncbi:5-formyltetrahydrofolate cyclo-ligase [Streptomyces cinereoruber]|uniref:5-formyltetrahydrofolate cyclo-ligase n=1 Tax=Streptomyces cinereoruber TaxID=67260 RepID=UPI0036331E2E
MIRGCGVARPKLWDVDDELWALIEPLLPKVERRVRHPGRKWHPDRLVFQGILFVLHTGIAWEHLPQELGSAPAGEAAEKKGAAQVARRVGVEAMRPIDIVVCGSVAVNRSGARIGKGAGYSDLEVALLVEAGLVTESTVIVAPVHALQVVEDEIPETEHDFSVDYIVTPDEVLRCTDRRRPPGLVWNDLTAEKIAAIPVLAAQQRAW